MNVPLAALSFVLILARCAALVGFSPWLGGAETPRLVKVGLVVALSLVWFDPQAAAPAVVGSDPASWGWMLIGWLTAKEVLLGASLGYLLRLVVVPARMAGSYLGQEIGLSLAWLADPDSPSGGNLMAHVMELFAGLLFFTLDVHHWVLAGVDIAFRAIPLGGSSPQLSAPLLAASLDKACAQALLIIAPVAIALFVTAVAISLLARTVPQLNLLSVGFPVRLIVGLALTFYFWPQIMQLMGRMLLGGTAGWLRGIHGA